MVKEKTKLICIDCPVGCEINVIYDGKTVLEVDGNKCKKGINYAETEISDPKRMIVTTVRVVKGLHRLVPVRSKEAILKNKIFKVLDKLRKIELDAPVEMHQIVLSNAAGTGVDIITSRSLPAKRE
jgi:CxxC motif-containing protein